ncbi:MAG TPA: ABC transporter substrate-binding protein, partial [Dongiaceae bacterium]|nr:ABC transporter substrate-binding protein [Dongiaceae bacterium]
EITPASTATNITELAKLRHWTTLFRVVNNDYEGGRFTARYFAQRYANRPVAFIHAADSYGVTTTRSFRAEMQSHGMAPSIDRSLAVDGAGLQDLVATLRQVDVAAIFLVANADDAGAVLRAIRRAGIGADVYGSMAIEDAAFRPAAGNAADGTRFGMRAITINDSLTPDLAAKYGKHVARRQSFVPVAYAAVQAWAAGVTRAHSLGGTAVAAAMRQAPVDTAIGRLSWDEKGDLLTSLYGWYVWRGDTYQLDKTE